MKQKKDELKDLFLTHQSEWDEYEPIKGHEDRFLKKLKTAQLSGKKRSFPWIFSMAASLVLVTSVILWFTRETESFPTGGTVLSDQTMETQRYFISLIEGELEKIKKEETPGNKRIIEDAMKELERLDRDYEQIKKELLSNGETKELIYALITNFQTRVAFLENVLEQIEIKKLQKNITNENII